MNYQNHSDSYAPGQLNMVPSLLNEEALYGSL